MQLTRSADWVGTRAHRSGWPFVMQAVQRFADNTGVLVDDFCEQTFAYNPKSKDNKHIQRHLQNPWVGILHHPLQINSPLKHDKSHELINIGTRLDWQKCLPTLKGVVVLSNTLQSFVENWLRVPVVTIKHPTDLQCEQFNFAKWQNDRMIICVGFFLRDTRILHRVVQPATYIFTRCKPFLDWMKRRDRKLAQSQHKSEIKSTNVADFDFLDNYNYDRVLARSVVVSWFYGAAANNTIVECIARNTPIIVNRLPSVVEYLGEDYPLYANNTNEIHKLIQDHSRINLAHMYLKHFINKDYLNANNFAKQLQDFTERVI